MEPNAYTATLLVNGTFKKAQRKENSRSWAGDGRLKTKYSCENGGSGGGKTVYARRLRTARV